MKYLHKINKFVSFKIIKLSDHNLKFLGFFKLVDCLIGLKNTGLDLIEINFKDNVSFCKILNYNKFIYSELKKKKNKKNINNKKCKEIKLHLFISDNDYFNKLRRIKKFLICNLKVKINLIIKGREIIKINIINDKIQRIINDVSIYGSLINKPNSKLRNIFLFFNPKKK